MKQTVLLVLVALLALGCVRQEAPHQDLQLPTGRTVKVLSVGKLYFSNDRPALTLKYQTDLPITNVDALGAEVDEIWMVFQPEVDRANVTNAIITASTPPKGTFVTTGSNYNFVFQKGEDGTWRRMANR
ncbi:MAG: hypothetical protein JOZ54_08835 [Acidobacteria bacterium]|nr:hypothetical protein [Acidobacteriota bacterium]